MTVDGTVNGDFQVYARRKALKWRLNTDVFGLPIDIEDLKFRPKNTEEDHKPQNALNPWGINLSMRHPLYSRTQMHHSGLTFDSIQGGRWLRKHWIFDSTLPEQKPDAMRLVSRPVRWMPNSVHPEALKPGWPRLKGLQKGYASSSASAKACINLSSSITRAETLSNGYPPEDAETQPQR
ncbi:hypothetical protein B0H10DRAFT_1961634 [Mycena sp. CBHHK59/15]|nr:hypothetical protein B0H10DRAFT_1961634 [Mycena sp. CBHHK59/15]